MTEGCGQVDWRDDRGVQVHLCEHHCYDWRVDGSIYFDQRQRFLLMNMYEVLYTAKLQTNGEVIHLFQSSFDLRVGGIYLCMFQFQLSKFHKMLTVRSNSPCLKIRQLNFSNLEKQQTQSTIKTATLNNSKNVS